MDKYKTNVPGFTLRPANENDCQTIFELIVGLAKYEKMEDLVVATVDKVRDTIFKNKCAEVIIGEQDGEPIAFALFFTNYSTFIGGPNLYLEDVFVKEEYRGFGRGKSIFKYLAKLAIDRGYSRFDWVCLDWNKPSRDFYENMGAIPMTEWIIYRLQGDELKNVAEQ